MSDPSGRPEKPSEPACPFCKLSHPGGEDACWFKHPEKRPARRSRHLAPDSQREGERSPKKNFETSTRNYGNTEVKIIREKPPGGRKSPLPRSDDREKPESELMTRVNLYDVKERIKMLQEKRQEIDMQLYEAKKEAEHLRRREISPGRGNLEQMDAEMRRLHVAEREATVRERESRAARREEARLEVPERKEAQRRDRTHGWREVQASGTPKADIVRPPPRR